MIDFRNAVYVKLSPWDLSQAHGELGEILIPNEELQLAFSGMRDSVSFTDRRIIALNVQGMTGKKKDYTSLPYGKVQAFSVETAGTFDRDSELTLWFSGLGRVKLEFSRDVDIRAVSRLVGNHVL